MSRAMSNQSIQSDVGTGGGAHLTSNLVLQRSCACGGAAGLAGECEECKGLQLQRAGFAASPTNLAPPIVGDVIRSPGEPLERDLRNFMESRLGHDFSRVRIHTGQRESESARSVNANAYTVGSHVVFAGNQYSPTSLRGKRLIAHELTHVIQQGFAMKLDGQKTNAGIGSTVSAESGSTLYRQVRPGGQGGAGLSRARLRQLQSLYSTSGNRQVAQVATAIGRCLANSSGDCQRLVTDDDVFVLMGAYEYIREREGRERAESALRGRRLIHVASELAIEEAGNELGDSSERASDQPLIAGIPPVVPPTAPPGGTPIHIVESALAELAAERTAQSAVTRAVATEVVAPNVARAGATSAGAAVAEFAVPAALAVVVAALLIAAGIGVYTSIAAIRFQRRLRVAGYVVLPDPQQVCMGLCHSNGQGARSGENLGSIFEGQPSPLTTEDRRVLGEWIGRRSPEVDIDDLNREEREILRGWLEPAEAISQDESPGPAAATQVARQRRRRRRRGCILQPVRHPSSGTSYSDFHNEFAHYVGRQKGYANYAGAGPALGQEELLVVPPNGPPTTYDVHDVNSNNVWEVKTRHDVFGPVRIALSPHIPGFHQRIAYLSGQLALHKSVADQCDLNLQYAFSNCDGYLAFLHTWQGQVPMHYIPYPPESRVPCDPTADFFLLGN
jgi:hypothetical protein